MDLGDYDAVLIDGRSGSGKTTLTERLVARQRLDGVGVQVMHVEDLYPGWDGLAAGSESVATALDTGGYRLPRLGSRRVRRVGSAGFRAPVGDRGLRCDHNQEHSRPHGGGQSECELRCPSQARHEYTRCGSRAPLISGVSGHWLVMVRRFDLTGIAGLHKKNSYLRSRCRRCTPTRSSASNNARLRWRPGAARLFEC